MIDEVNVTLLEGVTDRSTWINRVVYLIAHCHDCLQILKVPAIFRLQK